MSCRAAAAQPSTTQNQSRRSPCRSHSEDLLASSTRSKSLSQGNSRHLQTLGRSSRQKLVSVHSASGPDSNTSSSCQLIRIVFPNVSLPLPSLLYRLGWCRRSKEPSRPLAVDKRTVVRDGALCD